jgi:RNA ligase
MKCKFDSYLRRHRIVTNVSSKTIWEYLKNGEEFNKIIEKVPDEFYNWVKKTKEKLENQYLYIENEARKEFVDIYYYGNMVGRREFAMVAKDNKYRSILFAIYDNKKYDYMIWNMIKPGYDGDDDLN